MRIGLLADLHANREATEACLKALARAGCERHAFLGDLVGYGADPEWMLDTVRRHAERGDAVVLGNHDAAVEDPASSHLHDQARAAIAWTRERLDADQRAFLRGLPLQVEEADRLYVHANAWEPAGWSYLGSEQAARRSMDATGQRLTFCGHVHDPTLYFDSTVAGAATRFRPHPGVPIPLLTRRRWLAVAGSCGQPRDGNPAACCAWLDTDRRQLTFLRVPYDHARAAAKIRAAGLPDAFAQRLIEGG